MHDKEMAEERKSYHVLKPYISCVPGVACHIYRECVGDFGHNQNYPVLFLHISD